MFRNLFVIFSLAFISFTFPLAAQEDGEKTEESTPATFEVPEGDVKELLSFIEKLRETQPRSQREFTRLQMAISEAAEKIVEKETDKTSPAWRAARTILIARQLRGLMTKSPEERQPVIKEVEELLSGEKFTRDQIRLGMQAARFLEYADELPAAIRVNERLGKALSESGDEEQVELGKMFLGAARRLGLVGKPLKLEGETVDHKPFKLEQLKGKMVLVDVWATWCGPCLAEVPKMSTFYSAYHEKGLEIVGLSIDGDREALEGFLEERKLPWIILHDEKNEGQHPMVKEYGISGIPCMMLVGRDGKVISIEARGEVLEELLAREFGPLPEVKESESAKTETAVQ